MARNKRKALNKLRKKKDKNRGEKDNPMAEAVKSERFLPKVEKPKKKYRRKPKHKSRDKGE